jgi:hypothetical protein
MPKISDLHRQSETILPTAASDLGIPTTDHIQPILETWVNQSANHSQQQKTPLHKDTPLP